jgi:hypothetical protein
VQEVGKGSWERVGQILHSSKQGMAASISSQRELVSLLENLEVAPQTQGDQ